MGNAANIASGALIFTKLQDQRSTIEIWRGCAATQRTSMPLRVQNVDKLSVSMPGHYAVASGSASGIEIVNLVSGRSIAYFPEGHGRGILSPDERYVLFYVRAEGLRLFELKNDELHPLSVHRELDSVLEMASDLRFERVAVSSGEGKVQLLDVRETPTGIDLVNPRKLADGENEWVSGFAFSQSSNQLLAVYRYGRVDVWDVTSGQKLNSWKSELNWVSTVTFIKDASRSIVFGTTEPGGFAGPLGVVIDTTTGKARSFETNQNYLWGAYIPRSDELFITGFWVKPRIETGISKVP